MFGVTETRDVSGPNRENTKYFSGAYKVTTKTQRKLIKKNLHKR